MVKWKPAEPVHIGCPGGWCVRCMSNSNNKRYSVPPSQSWTCTNAGCAYKRSKKGVTICDRCYAQGGSTAGKSLTDGDVAVARALVREGMPRQEVARILGVAPATVRRILNKIGKYAKIDPPLPKLRSLPGREQQLKNREILRRKPHRIPMARSVATRLRQIGERQHDSQ